jgi:NitT/TauT family transport system substrate-binding protein
MRFLNNRLKVPSPAKKFSHFISAIFLTAGWLMPVFGVRCDEPHKVPTRIGYIPITDHLLLGVAAAHDNATYKNLDLEPMRFNDMGTIAEGIRAGSLDGGIIFAPLAFQARLKGIPIKLVLLGHRDGSGLVVRLKPEIKTAGDLRGATIAIPHRFSTHNMLLHMFTSNAGLKYGTDFNVIEMPPTEMPSGLAGGNIDGYIVAEPIVSIGELMGVGHVLVLSHDIWKHHPDCVLVMREEYLKNNPQAAQEFLSSFIKAGEWVESHRLEAAEIGHTFLGQPQNALVHALTESADRVTFRNLVPVKEELEKVQNYMAENLGSFPQKINMNELLDTSFALKAAGEIYVQAQSRSQPSLLKK